jgi:hypothetical protein
MAKDERFHIALQFLAISFVIFAIHRERSDQSRDVPCNVCSSDQPQPKYLTRWKAENPRVEETCGRNVGRVAFNAGVILTGVVLRAHEMISHAEQHPPRNTQEE